jgi:hypothetical protein
MTIEEEISNFIINNRGGYWDHCAITPNEVIIYMDVITFYFAKDYIKVKTSNNYRERNNILNHFITNIINKYYPNSKKFDIDILRYKFKNCNTNHLLIAYYCYDSNKIVFYKNSKGNFDVCIRDIKLKELINII